MEDTKSRLESLEKEIEKIKKRNQKVEADKAWETSKTRITFIAVTTYILVFIFLSIINDSDPLLHSIIPTLGYLLSTASYGILKKQWLEMRK